MALVPLEGVGSRVIPFGCDRDRPKRFVLEMEKGGLDGKLIHILSFVELVLVEDRMF